MLWGSANMPPGSHRTVEDQVLLEPRPHRHRRPRRSVPLNMPSGSGQRSDSSQGPLPPTRVIAVWMMKPGGGSGIGGNAVPGPM